MSTPNVVPNVVGLSYFDAQFAILSAAMLIAPPVFVLSPSLTTDTAAITADSTVYKADKAISSIPPQVVLSQSLPAGTVVPPQTQMSITVAGFPVPGSSQAVPSMAHAHPLPITGSAVRSTAMF